MFANSLDSDRAQQNVVNLFVFLKELFKKVNFEKKIQQTKNMQNNPACKVLIGEQCKLNVLN